MHQPNDNKGALTRHPHRPVLWTVIAHVTEQDQTDHLYAMSLLESFQRESFGL